MPKKYKKNNKKRAMRLFGNKPKAERVLSENEKPSPEDSAKLESDKRRRVLLNVLLFACIAVFILSASMLLKTEYERWIAKKEYGNITDDYVNNNPSGTPRPVTSEEPTTVPTDARTLPPHAVPTVIPDPDASIEPTAPPTNNYVDNKAPDYWPEINFDGLYDQNSDFIAWLAIPGTNINYPVVWRENDPDNEYYLTHTFQGTKNTLGAIFIDGKNKPNFTDPNTIIYGHNIKNHSMFWTLTSYRSQSFYNEHPIARLITPYGNYNIEIFSAFDAKPGTDTIWTISFRNADSYFDWIWTQVVNSLIDTNVPLSNSDRFITLSTCSYVFTDARFVVIGKLVPTSEGDFRSDEYYESHPRPAAKLPWVKE